MRKTNLKSENINGKLITFTKEQHLIRNRRGNEWSVPTVRAYHKGKEITHTSYTNPKAYLVKVVRNMIKRGEIK